MHPLAQCPCGQCGGVALAGEPLLGYEARQVFDLPPRRLEVTEHRAEIKRCPRSGQKVRAAFPAGVSAAAQYGARFQSLLVYLHTAQLLPFARISELCEDLFALPVSAGTLAAANESLAQALAASEAAVVATLQKAPVLHVDESGVRVAGKLHWLHTAGTGEWTFYSVHAKRGAEAMESAGVLPHFRGWVVHDFWSPYLRFEECLHAFCNAHLLRELKFLFEEEHLPWAGKLMELLWEFHALKQAQPHLDERVVEKCQRRYHALLKKARRGHPRPPAKAAPGQAKQGGQPAGPAGGLRSVHPRLSFRARGALYQQPGRAGHPHDQSAPEDLGLLSHAQGRSSLCHDPRLSFHRSQARQRPARSSDASIHGHALHLRSCRIVLRGDLNSAHKSFSSSIRVKFAPSAEGKANPCTFTLFTKAKHAGQPSTKRTVTVQVVIPKVVSRTLVHVEGAPDSRTTVLGCGSR